MTAESDFMQRVCGACGGSQRLVVNGFDVLDFIVTKEKRIHELELEISELRVSLKKNPKLLFGKWINKAVEK